MVSSLVTCVIMISKFVERCGTNSKKFFPKLSEEDNRFRRGLSVGYFEHYLQTVKCISLVMVKQMLLLRKRPSFFHCLATSFTSTCCPELCLSTKLGCLTALNDNANFKREWLKLRPRIVCLIRPYFGAANFC